MCVWECAAHAASVMRWEGDSVLVSVVCQWKACTLMLGLEGHGLGVAVGHQGCPSGKLLPLLLGGNQRRSSWCCLEGLGHLGKKKNCERHFLSFGIHKLVVLVSSLL